jgi:hypothetical protein
MDRQGIDRPPSLEIQQLRAGPFLEAQQAAAEQGAQGEVALRGEAVERAVEDVLLTPTPGTAIERTEPLPIDRPRQQLRLTACAQSEPRVRLGDRGPDDLGDGRERGDMHRALRSGERVVYPAGQGLETAERGLQRPVEPRPPPLQRDRGRVEVGDV